MFDCHMHAAFSPDSHIKINDVIDFLNREPDFGVIITEHNDFKYPPKYTFETLLDTERYLNEYMKYRSDRLLLGVEIGLKSDCVNENVEFVNKFPFDCVIGSIHMLDGYDIYDQELYTGREKDETYRSYLNTILSNIKWCDSFDTLGHIDYICRCSGFEDREMYYSEYNELIDEILKVLVNKGKAMEINTRRLADKEACRNLIPIYRRFHELGGEFVTIGSDSHYKEKIGANFKSAVEIADKCNLNAVYFKDRKLYKL